MHKHILKLIPIIEYWESKRKCPINRKTELTKVCPYNWIICNHLLLSFQRILNKMSKYSSES